MCDKEFITFYIFHKGLDKAFRFCDCDPGQGFLDTCQCFGIWRGKYEIMEKYAMKRSEEKARIFMSLLKTKTNTQVSIYFDCFPCGHK